MGMNSVPSAERVHIGFFGRRNAGKSSVVNAVTGQELSVVSDVRGTTTDPVMKAMELLPMGPVVIIDTPGIDDEGALGEMRVRRTRRVLNQTDCAVLIVDGTVANQSNNPLAGSDVAQENSGGTGLCQRRGGRGQHCQQGKQNHRTTHIDNYFI